MIINRPSLELYELQPNRALEIIFEGCPSTDYVAFGELRPSKSDPDEAPRPLFPCPVSHLSSFVDVLGARNERLTRVQYFSMSSISSSALSVNRKLQPPKARSLVEELLKPHAVRVLTAWDGRDPVHFEKKDCHVARLCPITLDLDVGRPEAEDPSKRISAESAISHVLDAARENRFTFPHPSLVAYSGRGAYLIWLLTGSGRVRIPPSAYTASDTLRRECLSVLATNIGELGVFVDPVPKGPTHYFKRPGTTVGETGFRVC